MKIEPSIFKNNRITDTDDRRISNFLNRFLPANILIFISLSIVKIILPPGLNKSDFFLWFISGVFVIIYLLFRNKNVKLGSFFYTLTLWISLTFLAWNNEGVRDITVVGYLICILIAVNINYHWQSIALSFLSLFSIWGLFFAEKSGIISPVQDTLLNFSIEISTILILMLIFVFLNRISYLQLYKQIKEEFEQKIQAEATLKENEQKIRAIFDKTFAFIGLLGPDGKVLDVNQRALDNAGIRLSEIKGKYFWETLWWSQSTMMTDKIRVAVNEASRGNFFRGEAIHLDKDCNYRFVDLIINPVNDEEGNIKFLIAEGHDITERKLIEEQISASENQFRTLFEKATVGILYISPDMKIIRANEAFALMHGYSVEEILNLTMADIVREDYPGQVPFRIANLLKGEDLSFEVKHFHKDGHIVTLDVSSFLLDLKDKKVIVSFHHDITARKKAEESLISSEERWRTIAEFNPECLKILDREGRIVEMNPAGLSMLQATLDQVRGNEAASIVDDEYKASFNEMIEGVFRGEKRHLTFNITGLKGKQLTLETTSVPLWRNNCEKEVEALIGLTRDITEKKFVEEALRNLATTFANLSGKQFYEAICKHIAESTGLDFVFVGLLTGSNDKARILGGFGKGSEMKELTYSLAGSPCDQVFRKGTFKYTSGIRERCLHNDLCNAMDLEGCIVKPLKDKDLRPIGVLVGLHTKQIEKAELVDQIFSLYHDRVATEMLRNTAQKLLEESEEKFRKIFTTFPDAISITRDSIFIIVNEGFSMMTGYSSKEVEGKDKSDIFWVDDIEIEIFYKELKDKGFVQNFEAKYRRKDGAIRTGLLSATSIEINNLSHEITMIRDIEEIKKSQDAMVKSEELSRKMKENSPFGMHFFSKEGENLIFKGANPEADSILGINSSGLIGKTIKEIYPRLGKTVVPNLFMEAAIEGKPLIGEQIEYNNNQINAILEVKAFQTLPGNMVAVFSDISQRIKAENSLKNSEERFKQVADNAGEWIWEIDRNGLYVYSNPVVEKLLGYSPDEIISKMHYYDLFPPDCRDELKAKAKAMFSRKERIHRFQYKNITKNGRTVILETSGTPIINSKGKLAGYRGTAMDITERLGFIEKLKKLSVAVEQSPSSIIITDLEGNIEYVNPRFTQVTGFTHDEVLGKNPRILKSGYTKDEVYEELWSTISNGSAWSGEFYNKKKNGEFFWEAASISPIFGQFGKISHYVAVNEDISEKKEATRNLFNAIIETEERERQRYSHDLHDGLGPIFSTIKLYFQILAETTEDDQKELILQKTGNCINEAIQTIKEISNNLSSNILNSFGLTSGIKNFIARVNDAGRIYFEFSANTDQRFDKNIEVAIYRIVTELINNTIKHSGATTARVYLGLSGDSTKIKIEYSDNGCGFDYKKIISEGKGLGLSNICRRIDTLNGNINIVSSPGNGIRVNIYISLQTAKIGVSPLV